MRMTTLRVSLGLAILTGVFGGRAVSGQEINACASHAGQIRVVDQAASCRANETLLVWSVAGPKGDKGDKGDPAPAGGGSLHVVDANDTDLGPFSEINIAVMIPRPGADGFWLQVPVSKEGFSVPFSVQFSFKTPCPASGLHEPSERYTFAAGVSSSSPPLMGFVAAVTGILYFPSLATENFSPASQETTIVATGVTTCANTPGFPAGRYGLTESAPAPAALAPFRVVLR